MKTEIIEDIYNKIQGRQGECVSMDLKFKAFILYNSKNNNNMYT